MQIFKNRWFTKFAKHEGISDAALCKAVDEIEAGLIDADYGGGVIKQRIARPHEGKAGGYRTIILYCQHNKAFFVYGFSKNERSNISKVEEKEFKELAKITLTLSNEQIHILLKKGAYTAVTCNEIHKN